MTIQTWISLPNKEQFQGVTYLSLIENNSKLNNNEHNSYFVESTIFLAILSFQIHLICQKFSVHSIHHNFSILQLKVVKVVQSVDLTSYHLQGMH
jgi:hypothetical protein